MRLTCRGPLKPEAMVAKVAALKAGEIDAAKKIDRAGRMGCGRNFQETIDAGPKDGQEHAYTCPKCGVTGWYRAPLLETA